MILPSLCQDLKSLKQADLGPYFDPLQTDMSEYSGIIQCHEYCMAITLKSLCIKRQSHSMLSADIVHHEAILPVL